MKILGLDLGSNSIGWALIEQSDEQTGKIIGSGVRIIPMSQDILTDFNRGVSISQTAERTRLRIARRLRERYLLRRERLHRVLNILGLLPEHYASQIDFVNRLGKFINEAEPKLAYKPVLDKSKGKPRYEFIFKKSFDEMLSDFRQMQPYFVKNDQEKFKLIPYDWTIYYLRKKALTQKIEKSELAWIILNFNQKRGYYQLRWEDDETSDKNEYVESLKVIRIDKGEQDKRDDKKCWYNIILENGWEYTAPFTSEPKWLNTVKEFLITEELDEEGNVKIVKEKKNSKEGRAKRKITPLPTFDEIDLLTKKEQDKIYKKIKAKTEVTISNSGKTVGTYIYESLLQNPRQKIRGKLIRTIERKFYKDELRQILQKQTEFHPELQNTELYNDCIRELYRNNDSHRLILGSKDIVHLLVNDIIFYQRPLRSQKSSIGNCALEYRMFKDEKGLEHIKNVKAIPKSNPYYQEFRIWQFMHNLFIYKKDEEINVTANFVSTIQDWEMIFDFLNNRKDIDQKTFIKFLLQQKGLKGKALSAEIEKYRWNYVEDKKYPCNETKYLISARLENIKNNNIEYLTREKEQELWHIIYSVTDRTDYEKALKSFAEKNKMDIADFVDKFVKFPPFKSEYGSYSEKAIKKLLPLMRSGKYWSWDAIDSKSKETIEKILTGEYDDNVKDIVRKKAIHLTRENHFQGLQLWLAQYIVYGRHSEAASIERWTSSRDLDEYIKHFKQYSLRNPIVEQVVTETLRVVRDVWTKYGSGSDRFFNEIHVELGREMKNPAEERNRIANRITENENTNLRIKALLCEMLNDDVENVRPFSPMQQEILKIYEEDVLSAATEIDDDILKISKSASPSVAELKRYKLWLEQKYRSPYTGEVIPLNRLFTLDYEIEHIIPQSRYFDNSLSNKVICESAVNKLKDHQLGYEFIKNHHGEKVLVGNKTVQIFDLSDYENFVKRNYAKNRLKRNKLLMEEIPDEMIERQLNDTRYISKFISGILSNIVRCEMNDEGINSKNVIHVNGKITSQLKQDWGLNDVWNDLIFPRFERMNKLMKVTHFTSWSENHQKFLPNIPLELSKGFSKKMIDHRHHALDALVIACASRDHVNLLNNRHAKSKARFDLNRKLRVFEKTVFNHPITGEQVKKEVPKEFIKPWKSFNGDVRNTLENIVISFKQNLRVINKATNHYEKWIVKNGVKEKSVVEQSGTNWAIRKPLHKATISGKVELARVKVPKGKILTASRKSINEEFHLKKIESITDTGIQKILKNYLASKGEDSKVAFSPEGLEAMNQNIEKYKDGKLHKPIYKARVYELGSKFSLGESGNKKTKFVEAATGANLFYAIYQNKEFERSFETIPLNIIIERLKQDLSAVPMENEQGGKLLFSLSPDDLVYVPTEEELQSQTEIDFSNLSANQKKRLFNVNDFSSTCYFRPNRLAKAIAAKEVDLSFNKDKDKLTGSYDTKTASFEGKQIKNICFKLEVDRLGSIKSVRYELKIL